MARDYKKEAAWEDKPEQVKRREARNKARVAADNAGRVHKNDNLEVDHIGFHRTGSLSSVPTRVITQHANRVRQPPTKTRGNARGK